MTRVFLAFDVSNELKENLSRLVSRLKIELPDVKWVLSENIHCTLKFFGDVDENKIDEIKKIVSHEILSCERVNLSCAGVGVFPNPKKAKVIWAGFEGERKKIQDIVLRLDSAFKKIGFSKEERGFSPHLTLGRIKKTINNVQNLEHVIERGKKEKFGDITVESLTLYKSVLAREGSIYKVLKEFSFAGDR